MKKWIIGFILFFLVYVFFVVARTPAQWAIARANLPENIQLKGIEGTLWNASVKQLIVNDYIVNQITTHVNLLSLLSLNPSVEVTFGGALVNGPEGYATIGNLLENLTVHNAKVSILANDIVKELELPIPLTAQKYINVTLSEFVMGQPVCDELAGVIQWDNASVIALDEKVTLGGLKADLSCDKGKAVLVFDPKNDLGLTLTVNAHSLERVSGSGYIKPGNKFPKAMKEVLPFLGSADSQGRYKLNF